MGLYNHYCYNLRLETAKKRIFTMEVMINGKGI